MTIDPERLLGVESLGDALTRVWSAVQPERAIGGWVTVESDRAEREVGEALAALGDHTVEPAPDDELLGATCRLLRYGEQRDLAILEPVTEGPLAAALARHGEGSVALYLIVDSRAAGRARRAGFRLSAPGRGPFGQQQRVLVGRRDGPFILLSHVV